MFDVGYWDVMVHEKGTKLKDDFDRQIEEIQSNTSGQFAFTQGILYVSKDKIQKCWINQNRVTDCYLLLIINGLLSS
jgi:hypothetical protein